MNSPIIIIVAALAIICFSISCSNGEVPDESKFGETGRRGVSTPLPPATDDDASNREDKLDIFGSGDEDELFQGFTRDEIERNRIITIDRYGNEKISTDEEVIRILEQVRQDNSTFLRDKPHFAKGKGRRSIIGRDDRFLRSNQGYAPYSAIGYLGPESCTAYLVGPRHLITAAHCVHPGTNTRAIYSGSRLTFYLRRNCNSYGITYGVSEVLVYSEYRNRGSVDHDFACLLLTSTVSEWMGFQYRDPMPTVSGEICGYPGDKKGTYNCFYCSRCTDVQRVPSGWFGWSRNDKRLQYTCDTVGGMSGSPVMTSDHDSTSQLYSYGVHAQGTSRNDPNHNQGVRFSRKFFYDICNWKCDTGARCSPVC